MDEDPLDAYMQDVSIQAEQLIEQAASELPTVEPQAIDLEAEFEDDDNLAGAAEVSQKVDELERLLALAAKKAKQKEIVAVDHSKVNYHPFRKNFYKETSEVAKMTDEHVAEFRTFKNNIRVKGSACPKPAMNWAQCGLSRTILEFLTHDRGFEEPTPVQSQAIPAIMSGRDVIGVARTGSGKTIAFLLPLIRHVVDQSRCQIGQGPVALVMSPTRELAIQTFKELKKLLATENESLRIFCGYGGAPIAEQIADLKRGAEVVIGTPGRLIDLLLANSGKVLSLQRITFLVLDEADRMFDMGFGPQVLQIVGNIRPDKQAVLFSATFPRQMEALAKRILNNPVEIVVGAHSTVCEDVTQVVQVIENDAKFLQLLAILGEWYPCKTSRILVFVDRQDAADTLMKDLIRRGYPTSSLHGGKEQAERDQAIAEFKSGLIPVMVATSIAARGLDVKDLGLVLNYDCPNHREDYIHRVGRTGRAGKKGTAYTFVTPQQDRFAPDIVKALKASGAGVPEPLSKLAQSFEEKVKAGKAQVASRGFGGKGLDHIDKEREAALRSSKQAFLDSDDDDSAENGSGNDQARPAKEKHEQDPPRIPANSALSPRALSALQRASVVARQIEQRIQSASPIIRYDPLAEVCARFRRPDTAQAPATQPNEVFAVYDKQGADPKEWACEIDINDYAQMTRHRITNKETLKAVCEQAGGRVVVLVKGQYVQPGRPLGPGEKRLYLRVEGESRAVVEVSSRELKKMLLQSALESGKPIDLSKLA